MPGVTARRRSTVRCLMTTVAFAAAFLALIPAARRWGEGRRERFRVAAAVHQAESFSKSIGDLTGTPDPRAARRAAHHLAMAARYGWPPATPGSRCGPPPRNPSRSLLRCPRPRLPRPPAPGVAGRVVVRRSCC
jgi:hypothetical protein